MDDDSFDQDIVIRFEGRKWFFEGIDDEPLSRRQMMIILTKCLGVGIEEIAFMDFEFKENPEYRKAYFGAFGGMFLFCK